ncbi:MAG: glycosyltransferase family 2 protein [Bacteroidales bacterium]|nr:glycosyltransferase family 2 protein [Bacteroidales bacterium]
MGFASTWLNERALFPQIINEVPDKQTGIIVVVPSYNEPDIVRLLESLILCERPGCKVEVIIVVNAPNDASEECLENNRLTISDIESWKKEHSDCFFRLFAFTADSSVKDWGVGLARKTGMDEAVRRFNSIDRPEGIILNLDADCLVAKNYFTAVYSEFLKRKDRSACSIYFEHPLEGDDFPRSVYESIAQYELHLRYYFQSLAFTGFPWIFHTVGSAIAVRALPYIKAGGMNRKQAGEDFYFIQKLVPAGGYFSLNSTAVYPSPRPSFRVPFGTGASIEKLSKEESTVVMTYNMESFTELRAYFAMTEKFFRCKAEELTDCFDNLPEGIKRFSDKVEWINKLTEIKNNTSGLDSFRKRFFGWFNMFRIVKYLNFVHPELFEKQPVVVSASLLLQTIGANCNSEDPVELLKYFRKLERPV